MTDPMTETVLRGRVAILRPGQAVTFTLDEWIDAFRVLLQEAKDADLPARLAIVTLCSALAIEYGCNVFISPAEVRFARPMAGEPFPIPIPGFCHIDPGADRGAGLS